MDEYFWKHTLLIKLIKMPASFITGIWITILNGLNLYRGDYCMYRPTNSGNDSLSWSYNIHTKFHEKKIVNWFKSWKTGTQGHTHTEKLRCSYLCNDPTWLKSVLWLLLDVLDKKCWKFFTFKILWRTYQTSPPPQKKLFQRVESRAHNITHTHTHIARLTY